MEPVLSAEGIVAGYGELEILHGASAAVHPGEVVCIIGPNGAGKSTFLKAIFGLLRVRSGRVSLLGQGITNSPPDKIVRAGLAYVPQIQNVFPNLTVRVNLEMGAFLKPANMEERIARVQAMFPVLQERKDEIVGRMSGGERQMVAIGRALVSEPRLLLLDEPTAGLAPKLQDLVFAKVRDIASTGVPVLLVEQNAKKALMNSDRAYVFDQGENRFEGSGPELLSDERVGKLYLGLGGKGEAGEATGP